jgi:two-component system NtrC family response regulator
MSKPRCKVLLIDPDASFQEELETSLREGFDVWSTADASTAVTLSAEWQPNVIVLELGLHPTPTRPNQGVKVLQSIRANGCATKVIVHTHLTDRGEALKVLPLGVHDFLTKPVDVHMLKWCIERASALQNLELSGRCAAYEELSGLGGMIGTSDNIRKCFDAIRKSAASDFAVLITGESGTGKELVAKALHEYGSRKDGPFVPVNCGAIPENLVESVLFGHERGAFTGAVQRHQGKAEAAQGGTLFLDEIGELPLPAQCKLLRFLQDQTIERVGGCHQIRLDVRIVAATNADLKHAMISKTFREDLYYRIGVVHLSLPPLRDRQDDAILIGMALLKRMNEALGKKVLGFTPDALDAIRNYTWPGNIRELENKIRQAVVMTDRAYITSQDLELQDTIAADADQDPKPGTFSIKSAKQRLETHIVLEALALHQWNLSRAAKEVGISRPTLYRILQKNGLCQKD